MNKDKMKGKKYKEKLLKDIKEFLYIQKERSEILLDSLNRNQYVGQVIIFRKKDLCRLINIIRGGEKWN